MKIPLPELLLFLGFEEVGDVQVLFIQNPFVTYGLHSNMQKVWKSPSCPNNK
jgi:hypothetical protein